MKGKTALITGGLGDIGRAIGERLAEAGANVAVSDIKPAADGHEAAAYLQQQWGNRAAYYECDVADPDAVARTVDRVAGDLGPIDICILNAGIVVAGSLLDISADIWRRHIDINLSGAFYVSRQCAQQMVAAGKHGQLVFIASWVQDVPHAGTVAYGATKSGLDLLMKGFAKELAVHGIRSNSVAPGIVDAGLSRQIMREHPKFASELKRKIPLGRLQTVRDVAEAVAFLCSPQAAYMTGSSLLIDGGASLFYDSEEME